MVTEDFPARAMFGLDADTKVPRHIQPLAFFRTDVTRCGPST